MALKILQIALMFLAVVLGTANIIWAAHRIVRQWRDLLGWMVGLGSLCMTASSYIELHVLQNDYYGIIEPRHIGWQWALLLIRPVSLLLVSIFILRDRRFR